MPIGVQWKWTERKTFLVVFHLWDFKTKPNLRGKLQEIEILKVGDNPSDFREDYNGNTSFPIYRSKPCLTVYFTWAPSHLEVAWMAEVLLYANILNGFSLERRIQLRSVLVGQPVNISDEKKEFIIDGLSIEKMREGGVLLTQDGIVWELNEDFIRQLREWLDL